jgi:hypothetical protein
MLVSQSSLGFASGGFPEQPEDVLCAEQPVIIDVCSAAPEWLFGVLRRCRVDDLRRSGSSEQLARDMALQPPATET